MNESEVKVICISLID